MVGPGTAGKPGEADGFDSRVSLGMWFQGKIEETCDSWELYALTGHVRFSEGAEYPFVGKRQCGTTINLVAYPWAQTITQPKRTQITRPKRGAAAILNHSFLAAIRVIVAVRQRMWTPPVSVVSAI